MQPFMLSELAAVTPGSPTQPWTLDKRVGSMAETLYLAYGED